MMNKMKDKTPVEDLTSHKLTDEEFAVIHVMERTAGPLLNRAFTFFMKGCVIGGVDAQSAAAALTVSMGANLARLQLIASGCPETEICAEDLTNIGDAVCDAIAQLVDPIIRARNKRQIDSN